MVKQSDWDRTFGWELELGWGWALELGWGGTFFSGATFTNHFFVALFIKCYSPQCKHIQIIKKKFYII